MEVKVKAYAKINLMLDIICTRPDGYHDLFMIMQSIGLYDTVTVTETNSKKITITCNIQDIPLDEKNIAYKAADAFFKTTKIKSIIFSKSTINLFDNSVLEGYFMLLRLC